MNSYLLNPVNIFDLATGNVAKPAQSDRARLNSQADAANQIEWSSGGLIYGMDVNRKLTDENPGTA